LHSRHFDLKSATNAPALAILPLFIVESKAGVCIYLFIHSLKNVVESCGAQAVQKLHLKNQPTLTTLNNPNKTYEKKPGFYNKSWFYSNESAC
jgi:hypothetical protein